MSDYYDATSFNDSRELLSDSFVSSIDPAAYDGFEVSVRQQSRPASAARSGMAASHKQSDPSLDPVAFDLRQLGTTKRLARGEFLYQQGDGIERIYIVETGVVLLKRFTSDGREQVLEIVGPQEPADLTFAGVYDHSAEAANDTVVRVVSLSELQRSPAILPFLLAAAQERARSDRDHIFMLGRLTAEQRLARFLLHLVSKIAGNLDEANTCAHAAAHTGAKTGANTTANARDAITPSTDKRAAMERAVVRFIPSRQQVADFTGLTLETVSRQLSQWRKDGRLEEQRGKSLRLTDLEFFEGLANA